jgi:hypothetical protein
MGFLSKRARLGEEFVTKCASSVTKGTINIWPDKSNNRLVFPRPNVKNVMKAMSNKGSDLNAKSSVVRNVTNTAIPTENG